jgi:hypothetical protein
MKTLLAILLLTVAARAELLLYEGFDYPPSGPNGLHGKSGGTGFAAGSGWTADANNETASHGFDVLGGAPAATNPAPWDGVLSSVPRTGNFAGSALYANAPDHLWAHRTLGPAVTNAIGNKTTLWMSYAIAATHFNNRASFAIGAGHLLEDRGALASGEAIGIGNGTGAGFGAAYWKDENGSPSSVEVHSTGASFAFNPATAASTIPYIVVARIEWDADAGKDRVSMYRWTDGATLSEATFNANAVSISADLNQAAFNTLSLQGARYQIDELRVGTTFADLTSETGGSLPEPLEITAMSYDRATDQITLTWKSNPGYTYGLHWSSDLVTFVPDFNHAIPAHPTAKHTTYGPFANPAPGTAGVFLRVGPPDLEDPLLRTTRGNGNRITLTFSEPMHAAAATNPASYSLVKNGGGAVPVTAAQFGGGPNVVTLTTGPGLELDTGYTLTMNNLTDLAGRPVGNPTQAGFRTWDNNPSGVKVFVLAGQSNMEGQGKANEGVGNVPGALGSLRYEVNNDPARYGHLVNAGGNWITRNDVSVWFRTSDPASPRIVKKGGLSIGFGSSNTYIGPEYGFGWVMGDHFPQPVLLIKTAWGGKSLAGDFRPPSAVAARGGVVGPYYDALINYVHDVLDQLGTEFPAYAGLGYQIAGFGWHQGWNDGYYPTADEYEANLSDLINDLRAEFNSPALPVSIGVSGFSGWAATGERLKIINAQLAVADPLKHSGFAGTVFTAETRDFWRESSVSPSAQGYHWNHNGETLFLIGDAMGAGMKQLLTP